MLRRSSIAICLAYWIWLETVLAAISASIRFINPLIWFTATREPTDTSRPTVIISSKLYPDLPVLMTWPPRLFSASLHPAITQQYRHRRANSRKDLIHRFLAPG